LSLNIIIPIGGYEMQNPKNLQKIKIFCFVDLMLNRVMKGVEIVTKLFGTK
jgi:hypothetical protein